MMSMHTIPLTKTEKDGLQAHGLAIGTPSQLSDAFRQGVAWGLKADQESNIEAARPSSDTRAKWLGDALTEVATLRRKLIKSNAKEAAMRDALVACEDTIAHLSHTWGGAGVHPSTSITMARECINLLSDGDVPHNYISEGGETMRDKDEEEMLLFAAKAIGLDTPRYNDGSIGRGAGISTESGPYCKRLWNPYYNYTDAFELAVKLQFKTECDRHGQAYVWHNGVLLWNEFAWNAGEDRERTAALCRAITQAAAVIGKQMEKTYE